MSPRRLIIVFAFLFALFLNVAPSGAVSRHLDIGGTDDFGTGNPMYLAKGWSESIYLEDPSSPEGWMPYASADRRPSGNWISFRFARASFWEAVFVSSQGFPVDSAGRLTKTLYLSIRYKDTNIDPSADAQYGPHRRDFKRKGAGVWACSGDHRPPAGITRLGDDGCWWVRLGGLGGRNDRKWKTEVFIVDPSTLRAIDGTFKFSIGVPYGNWGSSDVYGDLYVDWITLSDTPPAPQPESNGFWPDLPEAPQFSRLAETGLLVNGQPFFPIGMYRGHHTIGYLENLVRAGFNTFIYIGYNAQEKGGQYWGRRYVNDGKQEFFGLPDLLDRAQRVGLKVMPLFSTDLNRYWIVRVGKEGTFDYDREHGFAAYDGTYAGVVKTLRRVVAQNKIHPALLMWGMKDEPDHEDEAMASPPESLRWLLGEIRKEDPRHPVWVNLMGSRAQMFRVFKDTFDVGSYDRYPDGGRNPHDQVAEWAVAFREQTAGSRMFMAVVLTGDPNPVRWDPVERIRRHSYLALVHGAQGLLFWRDPGRREANPTWWEELTTLVREIRLLADVALHNSVATTEGYTKGRSVRSDSHVAITHARVGDGTTTNPQIHALFRRHRATGTRYLLAVNGHDREAPDVTFDVKNVKKGENIVVLFENRVIVADEAGFRDRFNPHERHVYQIGGSQALDRLP